VQDKLCKADDKKIRFLSNHSHGKNILKAKKQKEKDTDKERHIKGN